MYRQLYMGGGIGSLEAGAPSIKYTGNIEPQMAMSSPDPMADLYDQFLNMKKQGVIPADMNFDGFKELIREQASSEEGGIMDMVPREKALFGGIKKAVKKVTGAVKDVVSSDLGKAALLYAGTAGLGSLGAGGGFGSLFKLGTYAPGNVLANLGATATRFNPFSKLAPSVAGGIDQMVNKGLGKGVSKSMLATLGIAGASVLAGLSTADKEEIDQADPSDRGNIVKEKLRQSLSNLGYVGEELETKVNEGVSEYFGANYAIGGRVGYAGGTDETPKEKMFREMKNAKVQAAIKLAGEKNIGIGKAMAITNEDDFNLKTGKYEGSNEGIKKLLNMKAMGGRVKYAMGDTAQMAAGIEGLPFRQNQAGVGEVDMRETGGFIPPVGVKEKADDIPAMLSNNEFVFTADAVRAAGGGSVEKGAQRMYDLMKSLEGKIA